MRELIVQATRNGNPVSFVADIGVKALCPGSFDPDLKGGYSLTDARWKKLGFSPDTKLAGLADNDSSPLVVFFEDTRGRFAIIAVSEDHYTDNGFKMTWGDIEFVFALKNCRIVTSFTSGIVNDQDITRWTTLTGRNRSTIRANASNPLYSAGCYLLENKLIGHHSLNGQTSEEYIARLKNDKETLLSIENKKKGNIPVDSIDSIPPSLVGYTNAQVLPDIMGWGYSWVSQIGGVFFLGDPEKNTNRSYSMMFSDVLAKNIASKKMKNPQRWVEFFTQQADQLEGIARTYRAIADIARMEIEFNSLQEETKSMPKPKNKKVTP